MTAQTTGLEKLDEPRDPPPSTPPALSPVELARWAWRQLTSMRTALVLLFLLALAAVPGSVVPQRNIDAVKVSQWQEQHPQLTPIYDKLGLFDVYGSVWFSAVYILLMVSLVGCFVPRLRIYWRAMRAEPPRAPRHLGRLPEARTFDTDEKPEVVLARARKVLRSRRFRVVERDGAVSAERGYLREAGNLLFHLSVLVVLVGFAFGQLFGYKGGVITVVGQGFSNSLSQYDDFDPGSLFSPDDLDPLSFDVDDFHVKFLTSGPEMGQPESFDADVTYRSTPDAAPRKYDLAVNHPLQVDGTSVFLVGHGYAPSVTVRDGNGDIAYQGPVVFLPQDSSFSSFGVIKVPGAKPAQLGFEGLFLPTYGFTMKQGPFSQFPDPLDPALSLVPYHGDLGLDTGAAQSIYSLDKDKLTPYASKDPKRLGPVARIKLTPGQTVQLPNGDGSIRFDGVRRWVKLQVSHQPGKGWALGGVVIGILGLMGSLFIRPRRVWVRAVRRDGRTVVELAGLDRSSGGDLADEVDDLHDRIATTKESKA
ncbi:MAG: cytochrome c biogenesis protein ResB [Nocardioidaceae bacterium]|nr:cytochrome c biogenesis protein ResB [Nocardioidaceae bacterium]NUS49569.1 cytochrome c biogenesis protein ResB [Nocardioidaceae bacterium]